MYDTDNVSNFMLLRQHIVNQEIPEFLFREYGFGGVLWLACSERREGMDFRNCGGLLYFCGDIDE